MIIYDDLHEPIYIFYCKLLYFTYCRTNLHDELKIQLENPLSQHSQFLIENSVRFHLVFVFCKIGVERLEQML